MEPRPGTVKHSYSVREAAEILGCSDNHVRNQIRAGTMPGRRFGTRYSVPIAFFEEWRKGGQRPPAPPARPWS